MTTAILVATSTVTGRSAVTRYHEILTPLAEADTIGITADAVTFLHTVPAGGQSLHQALRALVALVNANALYGASHSLNDEFDACLSVDAVGFQTPVTVSLPVYVVA